MGSDRVSLLASDRPLRDTGPGAENPISLAPSGPRRQSLLRSSITDFVRSPVGRYVSGRTFAHFCSSPELFGTILVGTPSGDDVKDLGRAHAADIQLASRHDSFFAAGRIEAITADAFNELSRLWLDLSYPLNRLVRRQAIVQPSGMAGATLSGYRLSSPLRFPTRAFVTARDALEWLGRPDLEPSVGAIAGELSADRNLLGAARYQLSSAPGSTLSQLSRALKVSERSLQRRLRAAGTTFRTEVTRARLEAAKKLLSESDLKLGVIALEVGCGSAQRFSTLFHRLTGLTPSAWRAAARKRGKFM